MANMQRQESAAKLRDMLDTELRKVLETESAKDDIILEQEQEIERLTKAVANMNDITAAVRKLSADNSGNSSSIERLTEAMDRMTESHKEMCDTMKADMQDDKSEKRMEKMHEDAEKHSQATVKAILGLEKRVLDQMKVLKAVPPPPKEKITGFKHEVVGRDGNGDIRVLLTTPVKGA